MKKIAVTVAVLALGLAACDARTEENAVGNEAAVENAAAEDVNAATVDAGNAAENALDAASNQIENAGERLGRQRQRIVGLPRDAGGSEDLPRNIEIRQGPLEHHGATLRMPP